MLNKCLMMIGNTWLIIHQVFAPRKINLETKPSLGLPRPKAHVQERRRREKKENKKKGRKEDEKKKKTRRKPI